jgi:hypothetical protein
MFLQFDMSAHICKNPKKLDSECYKSVREFILKFSFLNDDARGELDYKFGDANKKTNKGSDFYNECAIQYNLYNSNFRAGVPLVPPTLTKTPIIFPITSPIGGKLVEAAGPIFGKSGVDAQTAGATHFGFIVMALASGFETAATALNRKDYTEAQKKYILNMCRFSVWNLTMNSDFYHKDIHLNNILINMTKTFSFKETKSEEANWMAGMVYIIDFGRVGELNTVQRLQKTKISYTDFFSFIANECSKDFMKPGEIWPSYKWLLGEPKELDDINEDVNKFDRMYNSAFDVRFDLFDRVGMNPIGTVEEVNKDFYAWQLTKNNYKKYALIPPNYITNEISNNNDMLIHKKTRRGGKRKAKKTVKCKSKI